MRYKVHVLNRMTGQVETAILTTEHSDGSNGRAVVVLENGRTASEQFEVLPFPHENELGASLSLFSVA